MPRSSRWRAGISDFQNAENPFADWYQVFIPYCTGDVHWGNNTETYVPEMGDPITIHHRGKVVGRRR